MMQTQVLPILQKRAGKNHPVRWTHSFNTFGVPETEVQQLLSSSIQRHGFVQFGFLPSVQGVKVTLSQWQNSGRSARLSGPGPAVQYTEDLVEQVRRALGPWLFSEGDESMEETVGKLFISRGWTLAVAESCTGGLVAHRLTEVPGSSAYVDRGIVSYSNHAKEKLLGVPPEVLEKYGAVSLEVAQAMARGVKRRSRVDIGMGITGIAGPGGGSKSKPVGMVCMAIDGPHGLQGKAFQFWGNRTEIKFRSSQAALDMVRRYIVEYRR